jgi:CHASE3 domain sensor protein
LEGFKKMLKNMRLSAKLIGGFVVVALITFTIGTVGWWGVHKISGDLGEISQVRLHSIQALLEIESNAATVSVALRTLLSQKLTIEDRQEQYKKIASAREAYQKAWNIYEPLPQTPEEAEQWKAFVPAFEIWRQANQVIIEKSKEIEKSGILDPLSLHHKLEEFRGDHFKLMYQTALMVGHKISFEGGEDHAACGLGKWMAGIKVDNPVVKKAIQEMEKPHAALHEAVKNIRQLLRSEAGNGDAEQKAQDLLLNVIKPASVVISEGLETLMSEAERLDNLYQDMINQSFGDAKAKQEKALGLLHRIIEINEKVAEDSEAQGIAHIKLVTRTMWIGMLMGCLAALGLGLVLALSINGALKRIIAKLSDGAEQVASASAQVSSSSQALASGASEQAAGIEETSSSLEEMSSMTHRNSENANQADQVMKEAKGVVERADESMRELATSMKNISHASQETSKIVKTIDEIAFQTNLLALNAAVEAARAGEAGAGFAVVADEVRNLAMRAADAAKNTSTLIEGTVKQINDGGDLVERASSAFNDVAASAAKVADLISEIASASGEQSQGIVQISTAVNEMDKVTQQNAANAEESASASEELSAQAESMKSVVTELVQMVGGVNGRTHARAAKPSMELGHPIKKNASLKTRAHLKRPAKAQSMEHMVSSEKLIPFDADLSDF